jgi:phenylacetic acid degradation operon negative regulatory protein
MPVRALVAAGSLFDLEENHVRVTLARLLADGLIERDQRGAYRPGPASRGVQSLIAGWRHAEERMTRWNGDWAAVLTGSTSRSERGAVRRNESALALFGFETLERGLWLRPSNLVDGIDGLRRRLRDIGLDEAALVTTMRDLDAETERRARSLWNVDALTKRYERSITKLEASRRRFPRLSESRAMVESFTLGGTTIRQIVRDPLLPPPFIAAGALGRLVRAMRSYDEAGRACWRAFLEEHGVDFSRAPVQFAGMQSGSFAHALAAGGAS